MSRYGPLPQWRLSATQWLHWWKKNNASKLHLMYFRKPVLAVESCHFTLVLLSSHSSSPISLLICHVSSVVQTLVFTAGRQIVSLRSTIYTCKFLVFECLQWTHLEESLDFESSNQRYTCTCSYWIFCSVKCLILYSDFN